MRVRKHSSALALISPTPPKRTLALLSSLSLSPSAFSVFPSPASCPLGVLPPAVICRYDKLLSIVEMAKQDPLVHNLSAEVTTAALEIEHIINEQKASVKRIDCSNLSKQRALQYLEGNLMHKQTVQAVSLLHGEHTVPPPTHPSLLARSRARTRPI